MIKNCKMMGFLSIIMSVVFLFGCTKDVPLIKNLTVEYSKTPIGIDVEIPRFSWQMDTPSERGAKQLAYQIIVKEPSGTVVWDSEKIESDMSLAIKYNGTPLKASTRYNWTVNMWNQENQMFSETAWFETGLMNANPNLSAWDGATWIGGSDNDLVFYSHYQLIFNLIYNLTITEGSSKAALVFGANDLRLMDKNKNIFQIENKQDESYFKLELDIGAVDGSSNGTAKINVYRVGYTKDDSAVKPLKTFEIKTSVIHNHNKNQKHKIAINSEFGRIAITVDGKSDFFVKEATTEVSAIPARFRRGNAGASVNLNPMGSGGNYIPFGMACDIGFSVDAGQQATFSDINIVNNRKPNNTLFEEDLSANYTGIFSGFIKNSESGLKVENGVFKVDGSDDGTFIVANPSRNSTPMLRTEFETKNKTISDARLYVTARGIYEVFLNGERIGDDYFNPGLTQYNKTHMYQTYDVTQMVRKGENAIGAMMGEGWWSGLLSFGSIWNHFGDRQSLLAKMVITYDDGSHDIITSNDKDWKYYNDGPLLYSSLDLGEIYDATKEAAIKGWAEAGFDDSSWKQAVEVSLQNTAFMGSSSGFDGTVTTFDYKNMALIGQIGNNAGVYKVLTAKSMEEVRPGVFVYNMGQNFVGVPKISIQNGKAGNRMILRVSEMLYPDQEASGENVGMLMTENYRAALCQDIYIMKNGEQVFQPKFTSRGYQFIEITGIDAPLPLEAVQGVAISSIVNLTADYNTSNIKVNQLWSNLVWSNVDNFLSIPTDCPQRNERMGWSGDISVFSRTATYVSNSNQFLKRHMYAMRDVQTPAGKFADVSPVGGGFGGVLWGSAGITVPWEVYQQYNDIALLDENYDAMAAYIDYLATTIDPKTGISTDGQLGDWLGPQNNKLGTAFLTTAYHIFDLEIMTKTAELLGKDEDTERFMEMYKERKDFFNSTFVNDEYKTVGLIGGGRGFGPNPGIPPEYKLADTQTSYAVGLALGAFSEENIPYMAKNLAETVQRKNVDDDGITRPENSLMTGFIGTAWISKALSDNGYSDLAYKLLQNNQYPSWLYAIDQGATTIWERLNGYTVENGFGGNNSMNSFNHYSFGAVGQWMMAYSIGIQRDEPGFKHFILQPEPDPTGETKWAEGYYDSMYGKISSAWINSNGSITYNLTVPGNTSATLYLPAIAVENITESGKPADELKGITFLKYENGKAIYEIESGDYEFVTHL